MPDTSIVFSAPQPAAGTHVLAVGVGRYPHLVGGDGVRLKDHQGLGQLSSPPVSARAVATWFSESFRNPTRPLASVRLLVSEANPTPWVAPDGSPKAVAPATMDEVTAAFKAWFADGDSHEDNLLVFYFCGHGLASGAITALLTEDFGADPLNALDGAIDFHRNRLGMSRCKAKQQLYLVDACRTDADMTRYSVDYAGRVFVQPKAMGGTVERPVLYSTLLGQPAHGRVGMPSHFAQALIEAFEGAGGERSQGDWRVRTSTLHFAIDAHLHRRIRAGEISAQIAPADNLTSFDLHYLDKPPAVPVIVSCRPDQALPSATLRCLSGANVVVQRPPGNEPWEVSLPVGMYDFEATFAPGTFQPTKRSGEYVYPPELNVPMEAKP